LPEAAFRDMVTGGELSGQVGGAGRGVGTRDAHRPFARAGKRLSASLARSFGWTEQAQKQEPKAERQ